jgi:hypothetical protein
MLSRVVTELGDLRQITPKVIEGLFAADLAYLQDFYSIINFGDPSVLEAGGDLEPSEEVAADPFEAVGSGNS